MLHAVEPVRWDCWEDFLEGENKQDRQGGPPSTLPQSPVGLSRQQGVERSQWPEPNLVFRERAVRHYRPQSWDRARERCGR